MAGRLDLEFARNDRRQAQEFFPEEVREVRIFGSRARGDHHPGSDLDLFVLVKSGSRELRYRLIDLACDCGT
ncbi:MAG TPA: nucleotidyltransferase domain-containing protein [Candidatus Nitrosotenuis sp.]|jgi:predicted nucleotidyltransferase|nr:nucleotidyltransferase domain-containing protein [Candidatus Nitrosotenuis sp.]